MSQRTVLDGSAVLLSLALCLLALVSLEGRQLGQVVRALARRLNLGFLMDIFQLPLVFL